MKKPANAGAHGLSETVALAVDSFGYAPAASAIQVRSLIKRGLSPAVAAATAALAYPAIDSWRAAR